MIIYLPSSLSAGIYYRQKIIRLQQPWLWLVYFCIIQTLFQIIFLLCNKSARKTKILVDLMIQEWKYEEHYILKETETQISVQYRSGWWNSGLESQFDLLLPVSSNGSHVIFGFNWFEIRMNWVAIFSQLLYYYSDLRCVETVYVFETNGCKWEMVCC